MLVDQTREPYVVRVGGVGKRIPHELDRTYYLIFMINTYRDLTRLSIRSKAQARYQVARVSAFSESLLAC